MADYTPYAPGINAARSVWDQGIAPLAEKVQGFLKGTAGLPGAVKDYAVEAGQSELGLTTQLGVDAFKLLHGMREGIKEDPLRAIAEMYPPLGAASDLFETNQLLDMAQNAEEAGDLEKAQTLRELANTIVLMGIVPGGPPAKRTIEQKIKEMVEKRRKLKEETGLPYVPNKKPPPPEGRRIDLNEPELDRIERQRRLEQAQAAPELDLTPQARAARAEEFGYTKDVYHGTRSPDVTEIDENLVDLGLHVGSYEQANNRLKDVTDRGRYAGVYDEGSNILPLKAKMDSILEMNDVGDWKNSYQVLAELEKNPAFGRQRNEIAELAGEADNLQQQFMYGEDNWIDSPENRELLDEAKQLITNEGYDTVSYKNQVENTYDSGGSIRPEFQNQINALHKQERQIQNIVRERMPKAPFSTDSNLEVKMQEFLNAKESNFKLPEETQAIESIREQIRVIRDNPSNYLDSHSYIILEPKNVRSSNADFNPQRMNEADLQAGIASLGATEGIA